MDSPDTERPTSPDKPRLSLDGPPEPHVDLRSRVAIAVHALLISLAAGAVTSLLSGVFSAF